ncbi:MAG: rod-binding protein, partial [bacterium]
MDIEIKNQLPLPPTDVKQKYFSFENPTISENSDDKLKKAAQDFEAIFVAQILHNMQRSISASSLFGEGIAGDIYKSMFDENMAQAIASKNGLHLSDIIIKSLQKTESQQENNSGLTISDYRLHAIRPVFKQGSDDDWDRSIIREAAENYKVDAKLIEAMIKVE